MMLRRLFLSIALFPLLAAAHPLVEPSLAAHSGEFEPRVYKVADGVYQAVGFALANSIMIEGDDGIVIVDVTESVETARVILAEFRKITDKPVRALIYTHNHADHTLGGRGFVPEGEVPVYAHADTNHYINRFGNIIRPVIETRSARMFGTRLPENEEGVVNAGIGPFLAQAGAHRGGTIGLIRPNRTFDDRLSLTIAGVEIELVHAPGETNDQLFVWLPQKKVLLPGDNIYRTFPNLYTIRGTSYRDPLQWVASLDRMRALKPEAIAPSHTRPIIGREQVMSTLTAYRDAIQFVHDRTVYLMNQGLTPDEIVERVELPAHLKVHPFLREHYGTVAWSVRSIFSGYLGWFDGDTATLDPAPLALRARRTVELAGGREAVLEALDTAIEKAEYAWAAELAGYLIRLDPEDGAARKLKAEALYNLGQLSISPNGRHYYLSQAAELRGELSIVPRAPDANTLAFAETLPIGELLKSLPVNLDAEKTADTEQTVELYFEDVDETYSIYVRRGVAELQRGEAAEPDLRATIDSKAWTRILLGMTSVPGALLRGEIKLENRITDIPAFIRFLMLFQQKED